MLIALTYSYNQNHYSTKYRPNFFHKGLSRQLSTLKTFLQLKTDNLLASFRNLTGESSRKKTQFYSKESIDNFLFSKMSLFVKFFHGFFDETFLQLFNVIFCNANASLIVSFIANATGVKMETRVKVSEILNAEQRCFSF